MHIRRFAVRAAGAVAASAALLTGDTAGAGAAPAPAPILHTGYTGPLMPTVGKHAYCNGIIDTLVETDPARPGLATVVLTSRGMRGIGPEWATNPNCPVTVSVAWNGGALFGQVKELELNLGEAPGETARIEINPGSGVAAASIVASYVSPSFNELRPQYSVPVSAYFLVP
jgi:hypothetical protein